QQRSVHRLDLLSSPTRRSSDLAAAAGTAGGTAGAAPVVIGVGAGAVIAAGGRRQRATQPDDVDPLRQFHVSFPLERCSSCTSVRSEEHTSELQSRENLVCRLLL